MTVTAPALWVQIDLDVATDWPGGIELDDGFAKIRTWLVIPEPRMQYAHGLAVESGQIVTTNPLVQPNSLKQAFIQHGSRVSLAQGRSRQAEGEGGDAALPFLP